MTKEKAAPNEPEVKAQVVNEVVNKDEGCKSVVKELDHPCKGTCSGWQQGFEAGQKSKAAKLKLPEKDIFINKWSEIVNDWNRGERKPLELFYNWLTDVVKSMNEGDGE